MNVSCKLYRCKHSPEYTRCIPAGWRRSRRSRLTVAGGLLLLLLAGTAGAEFGGGDGNPVTPFLVATAEHLQNVRLHPDAHFRQIADIDLDVAPWNTGDGWIPIGDEATPFSGAYDGNGFRINYLSINRPTADHQGLFGYAAGARVENLRLSAVNLSVRDFSGALVGRLVGEGSVSNCFVSGMVSGRSRLGGMIGSSQTGSRIVFCHTDVTVSGTGERIGGLAGQVWTDAVVSDSYAMGAVSGGTLVGGLVGNNSVGSLIERSFAIGPVSGAGTVGGLVGQNYGSNVRYSHYTGGVTNTGGNTGGLVGYMTDGASLHAVHAEANVQGGNSTGGLVGYLNSASDTIYHSYALGMVMGGSSVGGLVGYFNSGTVVDSFSRANVEGNSQVGGLLGYTWASSAQAYRCYSAGSVTGTTHVGGFLGRYNNGTIADSYWDTEASDQTNSAAGIGKTTAEMQQRTTFANYNFYTLWQLDEGQDYPVFQDLNVYGGLIALTLDDLEGDGSTESPYLIRTLDELHAVRLGLTNSYRLENDIDLAVTVAWDSGRGWLPIGDTFSGRFDGNGFTIRNLAVNRPTTTHQGLFRRLENAVVTDLQIENVSVHGAQYAGGLAGVAVQSDIRRVRVRGVIGGANETGGLVGYVSGSWIEDAQVAGIVHGATSSGGLVGYVTLGSALRTVSFNGAVRGGNSTGGLIGYMNSSTDTIYHSYSSGTVRGGSSVGGLIGYFNSGVIVDCYSRADVEGNAQVGGLLGYTYNSTAHAYRCYSSGAVTGATHVGGLLGRYYNGVIADSYWDTETSGLTNSAGGIGISMAEMRQRATFANYNFYTLWQIDEGHDYPVFQDLSVYSQPAALTLDDLEGDGAPESPYLIRTLDELHAVRLGLTNSYRLENDIDLAATVVWDGGRGWLPIGGTFSGHFDGNGFTLRNLTVSRPSTSYQGLFRLVSGQVKNLQLENASVHGLQYTGALAGYVSGGTIDQVQVTGEVSGGSETGGVVGHMRNGGELRTAAFNGSVRGGSSTGGLLGYMNSASDVIYQSYSLGTVLGINSVGGLVGYIYAAGTVVDSYSRADITGNSQVGGLLGYTFASSISAHRCYSSGAVTGATHVGGFLGRFRDGNAGTYADCYWDTKTSGQTNSAGGIGITTAEMRQRTTFANYNFYTLWQIDEGHDYPVFQDLSVYSQPAALTLDDLEGDGAPESPYLIRTLDELHAVRLGLTNSFRLENDIDLAATVAWDAGRGWLPIGDTFSGRFDGNGFTLRNLTVSRPTTSYQGLFRLVSGEVKNLQLENASVHGAQYTGALAGYVSGGTIDQVQVTGEVSGGSETGGVVGHMRNGSELRYASFNGSVRGGTSTGGLLGYMNSASDVIYQSYSLGTVLGINSVGGLVGYIYAAGTVVDSYSRADVSGNSQVGGLLGYTFASSISAHRCYSSGAVTGATHVGGFLGRYRLNNAGTYAACYWDTETSGQTNSAGGIGRTTAEMRQQSTFPTWNFAATWDVEEDESYPFLQSTPAIIALIPDLARHRNPSSEDYRIEVVANTAWTAVSGDGWITITNGASGRDRGSVVYRLDANPAPDLRTGSIMISDGNSITQTVTVLQKATLWVHPSERLHQSSPSSGHGIEVDGTEAWIATTTNDWITITAGVAGVDRGTLLYDLEGNLDLVGRTGAITIAGGGLTSTVTVHQAASSVSVDVASRGGVYDAYAQTGKGVDVLANAAWTATANDVWISIEGDDNGTGDGSVTYAIAANPGILPRTGSITIRAGAEERVFPIRQAGALDWLESDPQYREHGSLSATNQAIGIDSDGHWTASSDADWIALTGATNGHGAGIVHYDLSANTGSDPRMGILMIEGGRRTRRIRIQQQPAAAVAIYLVAEPFQAGRVADSAVYRAGWPVQILTEPRIAYNFIDWQNNGDLLTDQPTHSFIASSNRQLTARFAIKTFSLNYVPGAGGTITGAVVQLIEYGSDGSPVEAVAEAGAGFVGWDDGFGAAVRVESNVTADATVTARFVSDGGVPCDWYSDHGLFPGEGEDWSHLDDRQYSDKGLTLRQEYIADLDPNDPDSRLRLRGIQPDGDRLTIEWQGGVQARQYLKWADDPSRKPLEWHAVLTNHPPTPVRVVTNIYRPEGMQGIYRLEVERP